MQTVTMVISNGGDGSNGVHWFKCAIPDEVAEELESNDPETWSSGDGFQSTEYQFPDEFDFGACGISFSDYNEILKDQREYLKERGY